MRLPLHLGLTFIRGLLTIVKMAERQRQKDDSLGKVATKALIVLVTCITSTLVMFACAIAFSEVQSFALDFLINNYCMILMFRFADGQFNFWCKACVRCVHKITADKPKGYERARVTDAGSEETPACFDEMAHCRI